jgi:simple sugar transport system permease protein
MSAQFIKKSLAQLRRKKAMGIVGALFAFIIILYLIERAGMKPGSLVETGLLAMTPLALVAVGECINEKAGTINIGLEGILGITCVIGVWGAELFRSGSMGLLVGLITGAFIGFIFAIISVYGRADQIIAGMGINLVGMGLVAYLLMSIWGFPGIYIFSRELVVSPIHTPWGRVHPVTLMAIAAAILAQIFLYKTLFGLRMRAAGEKPEAVDVAGVSVYRIRIIACTSGAALCGLAGAFLALGWFGGIVKEITAGRGFIALACVVFAGTEPLVALGAAFIFGFTDGLASWIAITPGVKEVIPVYFINMIPYITTIVILAIAIGKRGFPRAAGKPYIRE